MKKKIAVFFVFTMIMMVLAACGKKETDITIDYTDVSVFEAELEQGADLTGKVVKVSVDNFEPQSLLGYNIWSGEHLNFISDKNPGVKVGDVIVVKVTEVKNMLGSWIINYKKLDVEPEK